MTGYDQRTATYALNGARAGRPPTTTLAAEVGGPAPAGERPVQVVLVEDHQIYLAGLRALLRDDAGIEVLGEFDSLEAACASPGWVSDVIVVVRQGLAIVADYAPLRQLSGRGIAVLVLAESESEPDLVLALRAGARGYLSRRLSAHELRDGIRALGRNEPAFDSLVARQLLKYMVDEPRPQPEPTVHASIDQLTQRQRAVALLVAEGLSNDEIASRLHVSQATVKSHLGAMMRRLDLRSRTQLAILINRKDRDS